MPFTIYVFDGFTTILSSTFLVSVVGLLICEVLGFSEECLVDSSLGGFDEFFLGWNHSSVWNFEHMSTIWAFGDEALFFQVGKGFLDF